ncbi:riboflavin synthase [Fervidobacterium islandicum]|uniref:Riboflavin synthase n=1 Tax=Fervidobacterium islandicum TaxID=2423 RepID=A0AAI8CL88_FERIS|nr:riboflavin synthase [Fervidobacterium islandicum]AMW32508.1 riboflavin synthase [Fervidobacterium islandicum]
MFTGIIQFVCKGYFDGKRLIVENPWNTEQSIPEIGESIAVNGVCLTVVSAGEKLYFDVGEETLRKTNLRLGKYFNLERSLRVGESLSGHFVTGHVDGTVRFLSKRTAKNSLIMVFEKPKESWAVVSKGSIAINGVSLTIANVFEETFEVQVIPHTLENTNLKHLKLGEPVNYEIDIMSRYVKGVLDSWNKNFLNQLGMIF